MRLVSFSLGDAPAVPGVIVDGRVLALADLMPDAPKDTNDVIAGWDRVKTAINGAAPSAGGAPLDQVTLRAPIPRPGKILAIGLNYADHVEESREAGVEVPTEQAWFCKQPTSVNDPDGNVELPKVSSMLDYEVELVAVIGRKGRHISREAAPAHVFGYTVGNDFTVRDWQHRTPQWMLGKSFDTHCPFGPAIVTADEVGDPHALGIRCFVNGERRQNSNTRHLVFDLWDQIAHLSQAMTLEPGDLIFTGTPGGIGFGSKPYRPLKVGDVVRCEIDGLGAIENRIVAEA
jgi:ureidoglycolate lyase